MARNNIPESEDDFIRMQQEAIRRVREMQERARRTLEGAGMHIEPPPAAPAAPGQPAAQQQNPPAESRARGNAPAAPPAPQHPSVPRPQPARAAEHAPRPAQGHPQAARFPLHMPVMRAPQPMQPPRPERSAPPPAPANGPAGVLSSLFPGGLPGFHLSLDSDQVLLAIVLYVLIQDHGDQWLILALGYIMLGGS